MESYDSCVANDSSARWKCHTVNYNLIVRHVGVLHVEQRRQDAAVPATILIEDSDGSDRFDQMVLLTVQHVGVLHAEPGGQHAAIAATKANHGAVGRVPLALQAGDQRRIVCQRLQGIGVEESDGMQWWMQLAASTPPKHTRVRWTPTRRAINLLGCKPLCLHVYLCRRQVLHVLLDNRPMDTAACRNAGLLIILACVAVRYCMCCRMTEASNGFDSP